MRVLTLLTFCPPGPLLRAKLMVKESTGICTEQGEFHAKIQGGTASSDII
jgi:hypothetical protein